jgi:site-specific DNA recombinase
MAIVAPPRTLRAAIYCRVSTPGQEAEGTSLDTQLAACQAHAAEHGYIVDDAQLYREVFSGTELWERPTLNLLRDRVRAHDVDVVIAYAIDRLSRDPVHMGVILSEADHYGVEVEFVSEPLDHSPEGELIRFVRGYAAKVEHLKITERTMRGKRAHVQSGKYLAGTRAPYGYRWRDDEKTALVVDEDGTGPVMRRIYHQVNHGQPLRTIAGQLVADGIPSPAGGPLWWASVLQRLVSDPRYVGRGSGFRTTKEDVRSRNGNMYKRHRSTGAAAIPLPDGVVPPLVDVATWEAAQERLRLNKLRAHRNNRSPDSDLLRGGFARCGVCGYTLSAVHRRDNFYRCNANAQAPGRCASPAHVGMPLLDGVVWDRVSAILTHPEIIAAELERLRGNDPTSADVAAIDRRISQLRTEQRNAARTIGQLHPSVVPIVRERIAEIATQLDSLTLERKQVLRQREVWEAAQRQLGEIQAWCAGVAATLPELTMAEKRRVLDALGLHVRVWKVSHDPHWEITTAIPLPEVNCVPPTFRLIFAPGTAAD